MAKLKPMTSGGLEIGQVFYCPGCKQPHWYKTVPHEQYPGPQWRFDGNLEAPTFTPSLKLTRPGYCCHIILTAGQLHFCGDCTHELAGQTVPLPDITDQDW